MGLTLIFVQVYIGVKLFVLHFDRIMLMLKIFHRLAQVTVSTTSLASS